MDKEELQKIIEDVDIENNQDPRKVTDDGLEVGYELFYAKLMTKWINILSANPSDNLLISGRGIHLKRWMHPRDSYPKGLPGYFQWKKALQKFHCSEMLSLLEKYSLEKVATEKISSLILKTNLGNCSETQVIEDAVSLIFIEHQLLPLLEKSGEEKVINAIQKTWAKMSENGQKNALELDLPKESNEIIQKALKS
ncbi:MAG: hypothetical protein COA79_25010 [Planctomycetota bacterium]|nr:MAG: hypothetical protein COA79_25010 [Planctomycetota bacterium]